MEGILTSIHVYPIKSFGGINLAKAQVSYSGLPYDRFWMLVDQENTFITQRQFSELANFHVSENESGFNIQFRGEHIYLPWTGNNDQNEEKVTTNVWGDDVTGVEVSRDISHWISERLKANVRLLKNTDMRPVKNTTSRIPFSDSSPYLLMGTGSLKMLNKKLDKPVKMNRFRPNLVVDGFDAHEEDNWKRIQIGNCFFNFHRLCPRCSIPNINQESGQADQQVLKTLSEYRKADDGKVNFGIHVTLENEGTIQVGDKVIVYE